MEGAHSPEEVNAERNVATKRGAEAPLGRVALDENPTREIMKEAKQKGDGETETKEEDQKQNEEEKKEEKKEADRGFFDVRQSEAFAASRVEGAVCTPEKESRGWGRWISSLRREKTPVVLAERPRCSATRSALPLRGADRLFLSMKQKNDSSRNQRNCQEQQRRRGSKGFAEAQKAQQRRRRISKFQNANPRRPLSQSRAAAPSRSGLCRKSGRLERRRRGIRRAEKQRRETPTDEPACGLVGDTPKTRPHLRSEKVALEAAPQQQLQSPEKRTRLRP